MNNLYQIGNALSVYGVLCMQPDVDHVVMTKTNYCVEIDIYAEFHAPLLQNLKKELIKACTEKCSFEFKHFDGSVESEAFSILALTWEF